MADKSTLQFYAENSARYVEHGSDLPSPELAAFASALPHNATVLELGTGSGRDAACLLAQSTDVTPTDASPELAEHAT